MTDDQLRTLARAILATGFYEGTKWALSPDKAADTARVTLDEVLEENMPFFRSVVEM